MSELRIIFTVLLVSLVLASSVSAIPEADLDKFRASGRYYALFDTFAGNDTQYFTAKAFHNDSDNFYIVFRANVGDAPPYDDFYISFNCLGDGIPTEFHTTDYPSWEEAGFVTFLKGYEFEVQEYYDGVNISMSWSYCSLNSATSLVTSGNNPYTTFYVEVVPVLDTKVMTLEMYCSDEGRNALIDQLRNGIWSVLEKNVNFLYTIWIVFQIIAVILVVLGIPILIFMLIRWAVWRVSGHKLFERRVYD